MLKIYYADISSVNDNAEYKNLSAYRQHKLSSLKQRESRQQGIGAELLLNIAVQENFPDAMLPLSINVNEYGKPCCTEPALNFSLSHSDRFAACALSDREIGLDIQKKTVYNVHLANRMFTSPEREYILRASDTDAAFTRIWCMKESYIKAIGTGLQAPMNSFSVLPNGALGQYRIWETVIGDFNFALCSLGDFEKPEITEIKL